MKTVGSLFKEARFKKKYSREKLGQITHIRPSFIAAIENGDWKNLPSFNITLGFVKTISHFLNVDEFQSTSLFRREYPPVLKQKTQEQKKKEIGKRFSWGPRLTFISLVVLIVLIVCGYLFFQYRKFNASPYLQVDVPVENQKIMNHGLNIKGKTDTDATVTINNQPVIVDNNGSFEAQIDVNSKTSAIVVVAKSRSGKESIVRRKIVVSL